ncbi:unnamed protein product [Cuscuta epithymum]|uniref:Rhamnogalacturonase A/B/Epimerase-like pectate lyase domain-containing protein n=1 Tax=Cuscuta epithymum TaxID=186058 RepID=A0AAV0DVB2_9ASTE|nr:unnamed protein product [Cuscuta epithymum]CAH9141274.1 unnamed protein product [Cuscuta epithymum]
MGVTSRMPFPLLSIVLLATAAIFTSNVNNVHGGSHLDHHINIKRMKDKVLQRPQLPSNSYGEESARVYHVTSYGADPTGKYDSTDAILRAIKNATSTSSGVLFDQIQNLGGARVDLDGGIYVISRPLQLPTAGLGNLVISGGTLKASNNFPGNKYLIDLSDPQSGKLQFNFGFITLRDLFLDSNYRGGGIQLVKSLRIFVDNCYITHFTTKGIFVNGGHKTYIKNSFLGQHITAGGDHGERHFTGTAVDLWGDDNAVTDVVVFSAAVGIKIAGRGNVLTGVHCYNKAAGFGGTGVYIQLPGVTHTRIVNSYFDYTGIVAEDPVQLHISGCFFYGGAFISFKSVNGVIHGVNVVDNIFSGTNRNTDIVKLDGGFKEIDQVMVDRNTVDHGMKIKSTIGRGSINGNRSIWDLDLRSTLLFPNLIKRVDYTFIPAGNSFPRHALRSMSNNHVVIESDMVVEARVLVMADQGMS